MDDRGQIPAIITIAIVSTNQLVRLGLSAVVTTHQHLRLIGEATSMPEAEELVAREMPRILIIQMEPEIDIKELAQKVKTSLPTIRIIALSGIEEKRFAGEAYTLRFIPSRERRTAAFAMPTRKPSRQRRRWAPPPRSA